MNAKSDHPAPKSAAQEEFLRVFLANEREVFRYVAALVPPTADAQEIVQQTAVVLWEKFDQYDASRQGTILLSEDNGKTWPHSAEFPDAKKITWSCLLKNGNILFATSNKLYLSTDKLKTGDHDNGDKRECHWLRGVYDRKGDTWSWKVLVSSTSNSRFKLGGINFVDGQLYWAADANVGRAPFDRGIFRCDPADLADPSKHTMLFNPKVPTAIMIIEDGVIFSSHIALESPLSTGIIFSPDMGKTWTQYDLKEFGKRTPARFHPKNSDGWFRVDLRTGWVTPHEVLFIKPK